MLAVDHNPHLLNVGVPDLLALVVGMAYLMPKLVALAADITNSGHIYISLNFGVRLMWIQNKVLNFNTIYIGMQAHFYL